MQALKGNGRCKSCNSLVDPGEIRCAAHERAYKRWLGQRFVPESQGAYVPRYNGIHADEHNEEQRRRQRIAFALVPGLRPEQPLKFD